MISVIKLKNFRSYDDASFDFSSGVNMIVGPNASGKTNIIEAILLTTSGSSYRGRDINLIKHDCEWSRIDLLIGEDVRTVKFQNELGKIKKTIEVDGLTRQRMPKAKSIGTVLFEPNHLLLFHGGPELRRDFLDTILSNLSLEYADVLRRYKRTLLQRNTILKRDFVKRDDLFIWNIRLSDLAGVLAKFRLNLVKELKIAINDLYGSISDSVMDMDVEYISKSRLDNYSTDMLRLLADNFEVDLARKHTTIGVHRDDILVTMNGYDIKDVASRGEVRTVVLAMKIFEANKIFSQSGIRPIVLLDDVFSELDESRRIALSSYFLENQVFITTTDVDIISQTIENIKTIKLD